MKRVILIASAALAASLASAPAYADSLNVRGVVAPICDVNYVNVSSGSASVAMQGIQQVANLRLACNGAGGATLTVAVLNGDLKNNNAIINYNLNVRSPQDSNFTIPQTDTDPNVPSLMTFQRTSGFSAALANGIPLELWLNLNVQPGDNSPTGVTAFKASEAPAGTYTERFTFTVQAL